MAPNPIDLTTLADVKAWAGVTGTNEDALIQSIVTAASLYWLDECGFSDPSGDNTASPFVTQVAYDEYYDGSGTNRQFLRIRPIRSVTLLTVNGVNVPAAAQPAGAGFLIDSSKRSLSIRMGGGGGPGILAATFSDLCRSGGGYQSGGFARGVQNVHVQYTAGFDAIPFDVGDAVRKMCATNYKRRQWIDQAQQAMANGAGTISFRSWELSPEVASVLDRYRRRAIV